MTQYFSFYGTAKRQEYWAVIFISFAVAFLATLVSEALLFMIDPNAGIASIFVLLAVIIATAWLQLATAVRRCRDAGISPWWVVLFLIPYVNFVLTIVLGVIRSDESNEVMYV